MSEAYLFDPYGSPLEFRVDGIVVGHHRTATDPVSGRTNYDATLLLVGATPMVFATGRLLATAPSVFGPALQSSREERGLRVHSVGYGANVAIFDVDDVHTRLSNVGPSRVAEVTAIPAHTGHMHLRVLVDGVDATTDVDAAIAFARAVFRSFRRVAESGQMFPDAWETLRAQGNAPVLDDDTVARCRETLNAAFGFAHAHVERIGENLEGRLVLDVSGLSLNGLLRSSVPDDGGHTIRLSVQGGLPEINAHVVELSPSPKGIRGFFRGLTDVKVGDRALDDTFLIEGDSAAAAVLLHAKSDLLAFGRFGAHVRLTASDFIVQLTDVPTSSTDMTELADAVLEFWRRVALFRAGLTNVDDGSRD